MVSPKVWVYAALVALIFGVGWTANGWRKDLAHAEEIAAIDAEKAKAVAKAEARRQRVAEAYARLDAQHYQEMTDAKADNDRLRADVADGRKRLLVRAKCPAPAAVPAGTGTPGVGDAAPAELGRDAEQAYHDLRRQHAEVIAALKWFQDAARARSEERK